MQFWSRIVVVHFKTDAMLYDNRCQAKPYITTMMVYNETLQWIICIKCSNMEKMCGEIYDLKLRKTLFIYVEYNLSNHQSNPL